MSFNFKNPSKIAALQAAGLTGTTTIWYSWVCGCQQPSCDTVVDTHVGVAFNPPAGVSGNAHKKAVKAILKAAGF